MNYSETYFELEVRKPLIVIIVTLSLTCTLKGMCQYNANDQSMYVSKGSKEALTVLTVLIVTHVTQVESGVCGFYATLHTEYCNVTQFVTHVERVKSVKYSVYRVSHPCQEGRLFEPSILGGQLFTTSQSKEAALLTFLDLSNYKGDCRQDAQQIPNS